MTRILCPAPNCNIEIAPGQKKGITWDARERPWHADCASRSLSNYFRTPLDLEALDGEPVEFTVPREDEPRCEAVDGAFYNLVWKIPHDFILKKITFLGDYDISGLFVGNINTFPYAPSRENCIATGDLEHQTLPVNMVAHMGHDLTLHAYARGDWPWKSLQFHIVGERFNPAKFPKLSPAVPAAYGLHIDHAMLRDGCIGSATSYCPFMPMRFDKVACDDWQGWEIVRVEIANGPGRAIDEVQVVRRSIDVHVPLTGRVTPLPVFAVNVGEYARYYVRDTSGKCRDFRARAYGEAIWTREV